MFTGIVLTRARITRATPANRGVRIEVEPLPEARIIAVGDSICLQGICLTVETLTSASATFFLSAETLARSDDARWQEGQFVNMEPSLRAADSMGGHIVAGHVDELGRVEEIETVGESKRITFGCSDSFRRFLAPKGSVAVDGVSLTINGCEPDAFDVMVIPHTLKATTLDALHENDRVHLEADPVARYVRATVEHYMERRQ